MRYGVLLISFLLLSPIIFLADDSSGASADLKLYAVMPAGPFEGVAVINYGTSYASLSGYSIYDGEGTVNLGDQFGLPPGGSMYFLKSEPAEWFRDVRYAVIGTNGVTGKGFALNDSGDDVYLRYGNDIIDTFVYGNAEAKYGGWSGDSVQKMNKKQVAIRNGADTDTAADWSITIPGRTGFDTRESNASVIPFTFPESEGMPLMDELSSAKRSICISVYLISHPEIAGLLLDSLKNGIEVKILVEGSPAGGIKDAELDVLSTLHSSGADIRLMSSVDGYRRYSFLHSKYAVIDGSSVIITSENWQRSSFSNNRGWGAIIRSSECASQMKEVFNTDFGSYDTVSFGSVYERRAPSQYPEYKVSGRGYDCFDANVIMLVSPDNTFESMRSFIGSAGYRLYCEQLSVTDTWTPEGDNPISWILDSDISDVRILLDGTFDEEGTEGNSISASNINEVRPIAKVDDSGTLIHNKGLIADDTVWLGSVNWTDTSFFDNREVAAMISSSEVSDYFTSYFLSDWGEIQTFEDDSITISFDRSEIKGGHAFIIDAYCPSVPVSASYIWDTDGDGMTDRYGKRIVLDLSEGEHTIDLFVDYGGMIHHRQFKIDVGEGDPPISEIDWRYVPILILCVIIIIRNLIKKKRDDNGDHKRDAHR